MNEKPDFRTRLVADLFQGDWSQGPAAAASREAAAWVRRRRARQRFLLSAGAAAGMAAVLLLALAHPEGKPSRAPVAPRRTPAYQVISDEELLADVSDRPLLALREPGGASRIVVLDGENR